MQGNQKNWRLATGGLMAGWLVLGAVNLAKAQTVEPAAPSPSEITSVQQQRDAEDTLRRATTLFGVMMGALVLLLGVGIVICGFCGAQW